MSWSLSDVGVGASEGAGIGALEGGGVGVRGGVGAVVGMVPL